MKRVRKESLSVWKISRSTLPYKILSVQSSAFRSRDHYVATVPSSIDRYLVVVVVVCLWIASHYRSLTLTPVYTSSHQSAPPPLATLTCSARGDEPSSYHIYTRSYRRPNAPCSEVNTSQFVFRWDFDIYDKGAFSVARNHLEKWLGAVLITVT